jgi:hypothetical protein
LSLAQAEADAEEVLTRAKWKNEAAEVCEAFQHARKESVNM